MLNFFENLKQGLKKTKDNLFGKISMLLGMHTSATEAFLEQLESILISSDIGVKTSGEIIQAVSLQTKKNPTKSLQEIVNEEILQKLTSSISSSSISFENELPSKPHVILIVGINGVGKTTSIAKLAYNYKEAGKSVMIAAADTFRAAATNQLEVWAKRIDVPIVMHHDGSDPGAVVYDTITSAVAKNFDIVLIDTAGRLHNKTNLMEELAKIQRVCQKKIPDSPHEVLLVLDANTGQNAIQQAKTFMQFVTISGLILTKLDGTAKGGAIIPISNELKIPVKYIGVGEKITDLQSFDSKKFIEALVS